MDNTWRHKNVSTCIHVHAYMYAINITRYLNEFLIMRQTTFPFYTKQLYAFNMKQRLLSHLIFERRLIYYTQIIVIF